jgi:hypothetical protein
MVLTPNRETGGSRKYTVEATYNEIVKTIGFKDNVTDMDDDDKVKASWGFQDESGRQGFIWCYKQSKRSCTRWSAFGSLDLLKELFPGKVS